MKNRLSFAVCLLLLAYSSASMGAPYDDGMRAYEQKNYVKAFPTLLSEAQRGNAKAQYAVGRMYEAGYGTDQNYAEAARWYRSAAEQGDFQAQHALSVMYAVGWGVSANPQESVAWLRKSARQGYYYAQNDLASRYASGRGVTKDVVRAYMWFEVGGALAPPSVARVMRQSRDNLAKEMTPAEIARAKGLATQCQNTSFAACE